MPRLPRVNYPNALYHLVKAMRESRYAIGDEAFVEETEKHLQQQRTGSPGDEDLAGNYDLTSAVNRLAIAIASTAKLNI